MKTPDDIKKGLECHFEVDGVCEECPYNDEPDCTRFVYMDALAYIQQLEAERDAVVNDLKNVCELCAVCCACKDRFEGGERCRGCISSSNWQWRGVRKEEIEE